MTIVISIIVVVLLVAAVVFVNLRHRGRSWDIELHVHDTDEPPPTRGVVAEPEDDHGR